MFSVNTVNTFSHFRLHIELKREESILKEAVLPTYQVVSFHVGQVDQKDQGKIKNKLIRK